MLHFAFRAAAKAAASRGRLSSASAPFRGKSLNSSPLRLNAKTGALLLLS